MLFNTLTRFFLFSIVTLISISTGLASGDSEVITSSETSTDGSAQSFSEPNELNLFYENGTLALENENYEEAILNFDKVLKIDQNHTSSLIKKGDALAMLGDNDMSIANYDLALEIEPKNQSALIAKARVLYFQGKYEEAIDNADKLLLINPENMVVLTLKGAALAAMGKSEEAIPYFDKALDYFPNYGDALINKGAVLTSLGRHLEAKPYLEKALELAPEDSVALINMGAAHVNVNRPYDAIPYFMKGLEKDPDNITSLNGLAAALVNIREYEQTILYTNQTLAIDPNNTFALSVKGTALVGQEKYEQAISLYEKVLEINPDDEISIKNLALAKKKLEFKPFDGNAEIILRDSDGGLVGFLYASALQLNNATIAQQMLDISPKKKITRDGQELEITTMKQLGTVRDDTVMAKTYIYGQKGQPFVQTMHWGYPVTYGDTVHTTYVISNVVQ